MPRARDVYKRQGERAVRQDAPQSAAGQSHIPGGGGIPARTCHAPPSGFRSGQQCSSSCLLYTSSFHEVHIYHPMHKTTGNRTKTALLNRQHHLKRESILISLYSDVYKRQPIKDSGDGGRTPSSRKGSPLEEEMAKCAATPCDVKTTCPDNDPEQTDEMCIRDSRGKVLVQAEAHEEAGNAAAEDLERSAVCGGAVCSSRSTGNTQGCLLYTSWCWH